MVNIIEWNAADRCTSCIFDVHMKHLWLFLINFVNIYCNLSKKFPGSNFSFFDTIIVELS